MGYFLELLLAHLFRRLLVRWRVTVVQDSQMEGSGGRCYSRAVYASYRTDTQHTSLAIYILVRTAVPASRCAIKGKRSVYILKQESLPPSYKSFLNKHGGKDTVIFARRQRDCKWHTFY